MSAPFQMQTKGKEPSYRWITTKCFGCCLVGIWGRLEGRGGETENYIFERKHWLDNPWQPQCSALENVTAEVGVSDLFLCRILIKCSFNESEFKFIQREDVPTILPSILTSKSDISLFIN